MIRKIINIDEEKCTGCGICAGACHEGAIEMIDGKAKLVRENFCDGFGDCLPSCPTGAITFEEREAAEYDEAAVNKAKELKNYQNGSHEGLVSGCPGSKFMKFEKKEDSKNDISLDRFASHPSRLEQWPCQIKLLPTTGDFYNNAKLLIAADCTAYAYANMHEDFMKGKVTMIGCPKLDEGDYTEKLTEIISNNDIASVTIVRMEVPCCGGLQKAAQNAIKNSGKFFPWHVVTISRNGEIIE
ncbi:4Fe-4S binding domain-containing protein [Acetitomaculum ruminis DSM 5522]|uniref:4Fe-4S binding domain-containing protein n=1 Tax=Acetitomaculum ruminis DSM 5522 TaxID=1120918 RepID=A0A1I1AGE6_9FIRM|nr:4Fe-4S binding protein [Acetitomaculum ruminis]SFB35403.1 4Fe-4S binding domain-containing protein [Acetitomaculum ruminis DSM 5522]